jgi:hypothetical protein
MIKDKVPAATDAATQEQDVRQFVDTEQPLRTPQPEPESS